ncbi:uncharacterized protein LOC120632595 isoform X2 [Pararge aegeria]|uniref:uncharacterized protein LOC120632595 isoform X2 n=1 Tax=Pararge aegeria TaxID=116150 RepID=UPI0019D17E92|nr:uncharacterized protein LOC120632595 isoform X2 [Pararge aegeria]
MNGVGTNKKATVSSKIVLVPNEFAMENRTMNVETKMETDEKDKFRDPNVKAVSSVQAMELESSETASTQQSLDPDDQYSTDCDPLGSVCGPHSNCPCSVHSKITSEDEDSKDPPLRSSLLEYDETCDPEQNTVIIKSDNVPTLFINKSVTMTKSQVTTGEKNIGNVIISNDNNVLPIVKNNACNDQMLYAEDEGPKLYQVKGSIVTPPIVTKNLMEAFKFLPIFGKPKPTEDLNKFLTEKIREYVGCDLNDEEFGNVVKFCSPNHLRTGNELKMSNRYPTQEPLPDHVVHSLERCDLDDNPRVVRQLKLRVDKDDRRLYMKRLKYRGLKLLPLPQLEDYKISLTSLEPGRDLVFRVRVYRPFYCSSKDRHNTRHSIFSNDIVLLGRQKLSALRDRLVCPNDVGMRVDVSQGPDEQPATSAKDLFPSGFLFINNVFYVDMREGCKDHSEPIREWARSRQLGAFPRRDMADVRVDQLLVYVHQGNCEHLFTFSDVRLLNPTDPLRLSVYPFHTAISQNQTIYCTTCAEFGAKWIVTGCSRVPFDPAFFCETCFKLYLYKDGKKICDFKAYCYRGNEINLLKPNS